jgi:glycosyltransferase involved in cell wall biosynthesis
MKLGHEVTIFSRSIEDETLCKIGRNVRFPLDNVPFVRHLGFAASSLCAITNFDLVHTQYHPGIIAGNWLHEFHKLPHVFTYHGFAPITFWNNPFQKLKMVDHRIGTYFSLRLGLDRIIAVSHFLKKELVNYYRLDDELIEVIYNGVDLERFNPKADGRNVRKWYGIEESPVVMFIGRLTPYKGVQFLLEAIPEVLKEVPEAKFMFVGSSRFDAPRIGEIISRPSVRNAVIFTGYVDDEMLPHFYACCDIFCYPSLWEGFGLTPAEAQAAGKPVVAFETCALPEVVQNGVTGMLVPRGDSNGIARVIVRLLRDPELRHRMGQKARARAQSLFSWEETARLTTMVYEKALLEHRRHK